MRWLILELVTFVVRGGETVIYCCFFFKSHVRRNFPFWHQSVVIVSIPQACRQKFHWSMGVRLKCSHSSVDWVCFGLIWFGLYLFGSSKSHPIDVFLFSCLQICLQVFIKQAFALFSVRTIHCITNGHRVTSVYLGVNEFIHLEMHTYKHAHARAIVLNANYRFIFFSFLFRLPW